MSTVTGHEVIELRLTLDQVTFIVSGLRDCAAALMQPIDDAANDEEEKDLRAIRLQNLHLANELEATYVQQLKG
jgi:hypothetical protein